MGASSIRLFSIILINQLSCIQTRTVNNLTDAQVIYLIVGLQEELFNR